MCKAPKEDEFRGAESTGSAKGMMAGANLFGLINAVLTCVVLGIVATRGGDVTKKTTNNAAADADEYMPSFLLGARGFGNNPCIDPDLGLAPLRNDLGDVDCEDSTTGATAGAQSATDVTDYSTGAKGDRDPALAPIVDYNDMGMCTVNVHWHIGAEHRSGGQYDETAEFDHPNKDTYAGSHRRLASADGGMRIGHMCVKGKELWEAKDPSVRNTDGSVNEYDWKYCKDMHVGLTYEFHWPHSSLGACQTPWQYQYHFLDGVLCGATMGNLDIATAHGALTSNPPGAYIGVEGQVFTIVNGMGGEAIRPTWDVLNGWDRQSATDVAYYQGSTTGDAVQSGANAGDKCRGTGNLVTWHVDRECHTLEASTMDEMCRRMLVISADDMSPDVIPHGARDTVVASLTDPAEDHPDYPGTRRLRGSN